MPSFEPGIWRRNLEAPELGSLTPWQSISFLGESLSFFPVRQKQMNLLVFVQKIFLIEVTVLPVTSTLTTSPTLIPARSWAAFFPTARVTFFCCFTEF